MANCKNCANGTHKSFVLPNTQDNTCVGCEKPIDASCVIYTGESLANFGNKTNIDLEYLLQYLDKYILDTPDAGWDYNYYCLDDSVVINSRKSFVENVSNQICSVKASINNLGNVPEFMLNVTSQIEGLEYPNITTSSFIDIDASDGYVTVLNKLIIAINHLNEEFDPTQVNWNRVYPVTTPPTNISQGFNEILRQLELLHNSSGGSTLPTINTTSTCLPTKTNTTALTTALTEVIDVACSKPDFNFPALSWGCVTAPTTETLQASLQQTISVVGALVDERSIFDTTQFDITPLPNCEGNQISIKDTVTSDGKVYVDSSSTTRQFLSEALEDGLNSEIEVVGDKVRVNVDVGDLDMVSVYSGGYTGYLGDAIETGSSANSEITINQTYDSNGKLVLSPSINEEVLADTILTVIRNNPSLLAKLCNMLCSCEEC